MRLGKLSGLVSITAPAVVLAAPAHTDVDTDFANQLHGYGIYGPRDHNAWLGKITCNRLGGIDADADTSAAFLSKDLPRGSTTAQTWQFLAGAIGTYCPDQTPGPDVGCATALMGVHPGCDAKPARR
jgi:Protein of unknown function (DUF732)